MVEHRNRRTRDARDDDARGDKGGARRTVALLVVAVVVLAAVVVSAADVSGAATAAARRCRSGAPKTAAEGPSASAETVAAGDAGSPQVEMVRYPRPDRAPGGSNPWSQWGQGLVLADGRFLSAIGDHRGQDGESFLFVYEPQAKKLTRFSDVSSLTAHQPGDWGYGKVHGQIVAGRCGTAWFATYWGTRAEIEYNDRYQGDALFRIDTATLATTMVDVPVAKHGIPSLAGGTTPGLLYGEAVDPFSQQSRGHEEGAFFVYDTTTGKVVYRSDEREHGTFRNVLVDGKGRAYVAGEDGHLLRYEPGADSLTDAGVELPGGGPLHASTVPGPDGTVYGVTQSEDDKPAAFFAMEPDGSIRELGEPKGYTASLALSRDGSHLYYVPSAHGDAWSQGTPVIEVDTDTGKQRTVVELNPLAEDQLDLTLGGSYDVALDRDRDILYVGANAGTTHDRPWGEIVLSVIQLGHVKAPRVAVLVVALCAIATPVLVATAAQGRVAGASKHGCGAQVSYRATRNDPIGPITFSDATARWSAIEPLTGMLAHAVAVGDVNRDGWLDLFVGTFADRPLAEYAVRGAPGPRADQLLLGGVDGFTVDERFPGRQGRTSGATFADLDGDGDLDLVIARNVRDAPRGHAPTEVLRNLGDGVFESAATLAEPAGARAVGLLDFDADGRTDLFVLEDRWSGASSVLLHNEGDFRFRDVTKERGLPENLAGLGVSTADLDGDGRPDLYVSGSNRLFYSGRDDTFEEADAAVFRWRSFGPEDDPGGVTAGDLDADGRIDLVVGQHYGSTTDKDKRVPIRVFMNRPDETGTRPRFVELEKGSGLGGLGTRAPHVEIADFDDDGRPDVMVGVATDATTPLVYRNVGGAGTDLRFQAVAPTRAAEYWAAGVVADFDRDGRLDVVLAPFDASRPTVVSRNVGSTGHWWAVDAPPGAEVTVRSGASSATRRVVNGSTGFSSGPAPIAWFGLSGSSAGSATVTFADGHHTEIAIARDTLVRVSC